MNLTVKEKKFFHLKREAFVPAAIMDSVNLLS